MKKKSKLLLGAFLLFSASLAAQSTQIPAGFLYGNTWQSDHLRLKSYRVNDTVNLCIIDGETPAYAMPVREVNVISPYGWRGTRMHTGIDLKQNPGDTIFAAFDGMVRMAKLYSNYGNLIAIRHANGLESVYAHLDSFFVSEKQLVKAGEPIGLAGKTGRASTEHLHFELRFRYEPFDPELIFDFESQCLYENELCFVNTQLKREDEEPMIRLDSLQFEDLDEDNETDFIAAAQTEQKVEAKTASPKKHRIKRGETLYSLARRYNTTVDEICQWNNISNPSLIHVGQWVVVAN